MSLKGKLFRALYDFQTDDPNDLQFKAGDIIIVQDMGEGTVEEWWLGELNGESGCFPGSYVRSVEHVGPVSKTFTAPEDQDPTVGIAKPSSTSKGGKTNNVSWGPNEVGETWSRFEYDRPDRTVDVEASHNVWIHEEAEEKTRQMYVRWEIWERDLPPGEKCAERIAFEKARGDAEFERQEKRRRFKEKRAAKKAAEQAGIPWVDPDQAASEVTSSTATAAESRAPAPPPPSQTSASSSTAAAAESRAPAPPPLSQTSTSSSPTEQVMVLESEVDVSSSTSGDEPSDPVDAVESAIDQLEKRFSELQVQDEQGLNGLQYEYNDLAVEDANRFSQDKCLAAVRNPSLNRYRDILPYDSARVTLNNSAPDNECYINASKIQDLLPGSPVFFTAQGPKPETVAHFWKMIAEYRTGVIVMVTRCQEKGRIKCEQYWPTEDEGSMHFPDDDFGPAVSVVARKEMMSPSWAERHFTVLCKSGSFDVVQLHFNDWPDHGVPSSPATLVEFIQAGMKAQRDYLNFSGLESAPITVHCSAGVGRTGVWCTLYAIMTYLPYITTRDEIDIKAVVQRLRHSRRYMVQTIEQYIFCFQAAIYAGRQYVEAARSDENSDAATAAQESLAALATKQLEQSLAREQIILQQMFEMQKQMAEMVAVMPKPGMTNIELQEKYNHSVEKCNQLEEQLETHIILMHSKDLEVIQLNEALKRTNQHIFDVEEQLDEAQDQIAELEARVAQSQTAPPPASDDGDEYLDVAGADEVDVHDTIASPAGGEPPMSAPPVLSLAIPDEDDAADTDSESEL